MSKALIPDKEATESVDLLNRQEFVDRMLQVAMSLSQKKKNACYALNGGWGAGKSFVMNMFEKQAKDVKLDNSGKPQYLVFHYNCWEYDYYEEPLIAIVVTMIETIEKNANLLDATTKKKIRGVLKVAAKGLEEKLVATVKEKTGIDTKKIMDTVTESAEAVSNVSQNEYDPYSSFKSALNQLKKGIAALTKDQTVIFIVDELDRCLPEYAIKVLERMHHLFADIKNIQVILCIDKTQLSNAVTKIYGRHTDVDKYLAKFISFEMNLPNGTITDVDKFKKRFAAYRDMFKAQSSRTEQANIDTFYSLIFEGMDIRSYITIIDKCTLLHGLMPITDEKQDYSLMCVELFLCVLDYWKVKLKNVNGALTPMSVSFISSRPAEENRECLTGLAAEIKSNHTYTFEELSQGTTCYIHDVSIWASIVAAYARLWKIKYHYSNDDYAKYIDDFWTLLQTIS